MILNKIKCNINLALKMAVPKTGASELMKMSSASEHDDLLFAEKRKK